MSSSNYPRGRTLISSPPTFETDSFRISTSKIAEAALKTVSLKHRFLRLFALLYLGFVVELVEHMETSRALDFRPIILFAMYWVLEWVLAGVRVRRQLHQHFKHPLESVLIDSNRTVQVSEQGVRQLMSCGVESFFPWSAVRKLSCDGEFFQVLLIGGSLWLLPINKIDPAMVSEFKTFIELNKFDSEKVL